MQTMQRPVVNNIFDRVLVMQMIFHWQHGERRIGMVHAVDLAVRPCHYGCLDEG